MKFTVDVNYFGKDVRVEIEADSFNEAFDLASQMPKIISINPAEEKPPFGAGSPFEGKPMPNDISYVLRAAITKAMKLHFNRDVIIEEVLLHKTMQAKGPELASEDVADELKRLHKILSNSREYISSANRAYRNISKTMSILNVAIGELRAVKDFNDAYPNNEHI